MNHYAEQNKSKESNSAYPVDALPCLLRDVVVNLNKIPVFQSN